MNILISDNWLREFLKTKATPAQIQKYLSFCGPSLEKGTKSGGDWVYSIEVTTNRIDTAGTYGIAREASAILPRFGLAASLQPIKPQKAIFVGSVDYLKAKVDANLCSRFTAVLIKNAKLKDSPSWMKARLEAVGVRSINSVGDNSNFF